MQYCSIKINILLQVGIDKSNLTKTVINGTVYHWQQW